MNTSYKVTLIEGENGDLILPFPEELMTELGWKEGDILNWNDNEDGTFTMSKKIETELALVEAVSTFRMRYVVEVPKGKTLWALDTVSMNEAEDFSQEHLGEHIVSHRVVNKDEVIALCDVDNDYCQDWDSDHKIKVFVTDWKETYE